MTGREAPRTVLVWAQVWAAMLAFGGAPAAAANIFSVDVAELIVGRNDQVITLKCDNDAPLYAFQMAVEFEETHLQVTNAELAGAWGNPLANNDVFKQIDWDNTRGTLIVGVVYDFSPHGTPQNPDNFVPTGAGNPLVTLTVNVPASTTATSTFINYQETGLGNPVIRNVMGQDTTLVPITPVLQDRTVPIRSLRPFINRPLSGNTGKAGKNFFVVVTNIELPGVTFTVELCGRVLQTPADYEYIGADTLSITAPALPAACGPMGVNTVWAPLKVTTNHGSDTEPNGFGYLPPPSITTITGNSGQAGKTFQVTGLNFNQPQRTVRVCGQTATHTLSPDGNTLTVTAPACAQGWAPLEVCTTYGCDNEAQGFEYVLPAAPPVITEMIGNEGPVGTVFQIKGQNFGRPGLVVEVCEKAAQFTLSPDQTTIQVTAPDCTPGLKAVDVCTNDGCASDVFNYIVGRLFVRGDANGDERVNVADPISIFSDFYLGTPSFNTCRDALDVDDDGRLNITDPIALLSYLFQAGDSPPAPFPGPGLDPTTTDTLPCP